MAGKSWEFGGDREWGNVLDHRWIRSKFVTGWSAAEGGPGASSHTRDDHVLTRLRRPCVMNAAGGPQDTVGTEDHAAQARRALAGVDAQRRAEFHRKKNISEINEGLDKLALNDTVRANLGWPFWEGPRELKKKAPCFDTDEERAEYERTQVMAQLHPKPTQQDAVRKWEREPFGRVMIQPQGHHKDNAACTCSFDEAGKLVAMATNCEAQAQMDHYQSWFGLPVGWQEGYLEVRDLSVDYPGGRKSKKETAVKETAVVAIEAQDDSAQSQAIDDAADASETDRRADNVPRDAVDAGDVRLEPTQQARARPRYADRGDARCQTCGKGIDKHHTAESADGAPYCYAGNQYVWHGPEDDPRWLDTLVWKPMGLIGPALVEKLGAEQTVENLTMGRSKKLPRELIEKRNYFREETYKDRINGGTVTVKFKDNARAENNIATKDWMTGVTLYSYNQNEKIRTDPTGHGKVDKSELMRKKDAKCKVLEKKIGEFEKSMLQQQIVVKDAEEKCLAQKMTIQKGRQKIQTAEGLIKYHREQTDLLHIRLEQEKREMKALEHEIYVKEIAKDLPIPQTLVKVIDKKHLKTLADVNSSLNPVREIFGMKPLVEDPDPFAPGRDAHNQEEDDSWLNEVGLFFTGKKKQDAAPAMTEKYFGRPLIVPATGMLSKPVVERKNADTVMKAKEDTRAVADIYLARSVGTQLTNKMNRKQKEHETKARAAAQEDVNDFLGHVFSEPILGLEDWAKSEDRRWSVFGSSAFPTKSRPTIEAFTKLDVDTSLGFPSEIFTRTKFEAQPHKSDAGLSQPPKCKHCNRTRHYHVNDYCFDTEIRRMQRGQRTNKSAGPGCTAGKVVGSTSQYLQQDREAAYFGFHSVIPADDERRFELDRWGIEPEDQWAVGKAFHDTIKTQMYSADPGMTPNITLAGGSSAFGYAQSVREAARPISQRDTAKPVVQDRPFNGPSPNR